MKAQERKELLQALKARFEKHMHRHQGVEWANVQARLEGSSDALGSLQAMESTGGEPDVIGQDSLTGRFTFCDCSAESPAARRSVCYDREALGSRKEHKPGGSAVEMAAAMGIDLLTEKQYRELLAFPGVDLDEIPGSNFGRAMLEWNLPPLRFREAGTSSFYVSWMRPALFASAMITNVDSEKGLATDAARHVVENVGAQVDFRIFALSRLELTLSLGQAWAFEEGKGTRSETMVSFKILK